MQPRCLGHDPTAILYLPVVTRRVADLVPLGQLGDIHNSVMLVQQGSKSTLKKSIWPYQWCPPDEQAYRWHQYVGAGCSEDPGEVPLSRGGQIARRLFDPASVGEAALRCRQLETLSRRSGGGGPGMSK